MRTATHLFLHPPLPPLATFRPLSPLRPITISTKSPSPLKNLTPLPSNPSLRPNIKHLTAITFASAPQNPSQILTDPFPLDLSLITPINVCKLSAVLALSLSAFKSISAALVNPFFWTYFSWSWIFWPWVLAFFFAALGLYCARQHALGRAGVFEQLAIVTTAVTWLTLVPPAHFNGFLEGWPFALFFVYHYFFFFEPTVRRRLYGDLYPRTHDPKWDLSLPGPLRACFLLFVFVGHCLAAYEGPELHLISGGWANLATWILVGIVIFMRYHSVLYLAKYSEKGVVPMEVVQFGPYRWVRHPMYASTMLLFGLHCVTLRAPLSLLFMVAVCLVYYGRKAELEEAVMVETFGERYTDYASKVRYKLIPGLF